MATRVNLCPNPCLTNNNTGWGGGSTPTRTDVSALGFDRQWAARYTAGSFILSPVAAATPGLVYTVSAYARPENFDLNGTVWIEFLDTGGSTISEVTDTFSAPEGVVTRFSVSATAPVGAVGVQLVVTGENYASNATSYTMCLMEQSSTLGDYFDGDSDGASWDGTPGNSTSTLSDSPATVTGGIDGALPTLTGAASGTLTTTGTTTGALPALNGSASGTLTDSGALTGAMPLVTATGSGVVFDAASLMGTLPALTGSLAGTEATTGDLAGNFPLLTGEAAGTATSSGTLAGTLPLLAADLSSDVPAQGPFAGALPTLTGSLSAGASTAGTIAGALPALSGSLVGIPPGLVQAIRVVVNGA
ncbi:MAG TPA: hypothetical protein VFU47_12535, partial [Armatimonadota bacterium]|nr:hypothetical protein [Armatimonadota bacterium]